MGYYTNFKLQVTDEFAKNDASLEFYFGSMSDGTLVKNSKWYEHEEEMKAFSSKYPDILFTLYGDGEEEHDIWCKYFRHGKMQIAYAEIKFEEFDESKLQ
jgi:hypothetical protein